MMYEAMRDELLKIAAFTGNTPLPPATNTAPVSIPRQSNVPGMGGYNRGYAPKIQSVSEIGSAPTIAPGGYAQQQGMAHTVPAKAKPSIQPKGSLKAPKAPSFGKTLGRIAKVVR